MKKTIVFFALTVGIISSLYSQSTSSNPFLDLTKPLPYSQLIGFKVGGAFYISTTLSETTMSVFFENVMNKFLGLEIEMGMFNIPITNYTLSGTTLSGNGLRKYIELSGGFKFYFMGVALSLGLSYNDFISGYIITQSGGTYTYIPMSDQERDFFGAYIGPEINAQISSDLFSKVGCQFLYGYVPDNQNYTISIRFFISFAYGL